jgi:DnaD/phage-associated family protein
MARSRNIKPGFFLNDALSEVPPLGRILFAGLWTIADREGRLEDRPKKIKAEILPYDDCDVDELLQELHHQGLIQRYQVEGKSYIWVINFKKHQNPHKNEVASVIPPPAEISGNFATSPEKAETTPADSFNLIADSLNLMPDSFKPDSGTPREKETAAPASAAAVEKEFGRPMSPLELDQIRAWEEQHGEEILQEALKIAVLKGVCRLNFIDAILREWEKAHLCTLFEVQEYEKRRKQRAKGRTPPLVSQATKDKYAGLYVL